MSARPPRGTPKSSHRQDPVSQAPVGYDPTKVEILNRDPDRQYVLVADVEAMGNGPGYYEAIGFEVEIRREDGPSVRGSKGKVGEPITFLSQILMSTSKERAEEIEMNGVGGGSGQLAADATEARMLNRDQLQDSFRGSGDRRYSNVAHGVQNTPYMRVAQDNAFAGADD